MDRKSITVVVVVVLCEAGFAYSQGWFSPVECQLRRREQPIHRHRAGDRRERGGLPIRPRSELRSVGAKASSGAAYWL